jgi:Family of unknown function (DUF6069)
VTAPETSPDPGSADAPPPPRPQYRSIGRIEVDHVRYWSGIAVTAAIAALAGVIVTRLAGDVFDTPLRITERGGSDVLVPLTDSRVIWTCVAVALAAGGVMNLMLYLLPHPQVFFGLLSAVVMVGSLLWPLSIDVTDAERIWLIVVNVVVGVIVVTLVSNLATMTTRVRSQF